MADQRADLDVVEADVVGAAAAEGEAVVVDDRHAVGLGVGLDLRADTGVERVDDEDAGAGGDVGLGVGELGASLPWAFWTLYSEPVSPAVWKALVRNGASNSV